MGTRFGVTLIAKEIRQCTFLPQHHGFNSGICDDARSSSFEFWASTTNSVVALSRAYLWRDEMSASLPGTRDLPASQYDLATYWGRVRHSADLSDPR